MTVRARAFYHKVAGAMTTPTSEENREENVKYWSVGLDMDTPESFIEELDPGLLTYKDELFMRSVTSLATLKFLRPREVCDMKIPQVYKRLLIDKIISLQSPDTKKEMKRDRSPFCKSSDDFKSATSAVNRKPKQLKFDSNSDVHVENESERVQLQSADGAKNTPSTTSTCAKSIGYLENEVKRLSDERETLNLLLIHKKDELAVLCQPPAIPAPLAIPGNRITKVICDNCHHKGHKAHGNKGNQSCPFLPCPGYSSCGILGKHEEQKQEMSEVRVN